MDVNKLLDSVEALSKEELTSKALEDVKVFIDGINNYDKDVGLNLDSTDFVNSSVKFFLIMVAGVDGRIDQSEYELLHKVYDVAGVEDLDIDTVRNILNMLNNAPEICERTFSTLMSLVKIVDDTHDTDICGAVLEMVACFFAYNGSIDSAEVNLLNKLNSHAETGYVDDTEHSAGGTGNVSASSDKKLEILNHDATLSSDDGIYYLSVGAEIQNPNAKRIAQEICVKIIVKDSSGRIIETAEEWIKHIDSNSIFFFGKEIRIDNGKPDNYSIQVNCEEFVDGPENSTFAKGIECSHYNVSKDRWGDTLFTGNVHNNNNQTLNLELFFVFYDDSGKIVGGCNTYIGNIFGNSDDGISVTLNTYANRSKVSASPSFNFYDLV